MFRRAWFLLSGTFVSLLALALPFRGRVALASFLNYVTNRPTATASLLFQRQARFWNRVVLAVVFFLGLPPGRLTFRWWGRQRLAPPPGSPTYWVPRAAPEQFDAGVSDPF